MSKKAAVNKGASSKGASNSGKGVGSLSSKPGKGGSKGKLTEADLLCKQSIRPEDVLSLEAATEGELHEDELVILLRCLCYMWYYYKLHYW